MKTTITASILASLAFAGSALAQIEVKIGYALPEDSHYGAGAHAWQAETEEATNGAYQFVHFGSSGLGGEREVLEGLQLGTVEATIVSTGTLSNFVPEAGVFDIPFLFRDINHARAVLDSEIGQELLAKFEEQGLIALAWGEQGFRHITNNRQPIETIDDLAGLKIRTMENPVHIEAFRTLGAAPTPMAWPEVVSALQQGTIDGQENPLSVAVAANLNEVQRYLTLSGHVYSPNVLMVSKIFWDGLSEDEQAAFRSGAVEGGLAMRAFVDESEASGANALRDAGVEVNELDADQRAALQEALAPAYVNYGTMFGEELIEQIRNFE